MTKHAIIRLANDHGFAASYSGHTRQWTLRQLRPSRSSRAFDGIVRANLAAMIGGNVRYV